MMGPYLQKVVRGEALGALEMEKVMEAMLGGGATPAQMGALLAALRVKGETAEEIVGAVRALGRQTPRLSVPGPKASLDRDEINVEQEMVEATHQNGATKTFSVSTAAAFVLAGGGVRVVKHGKLMRGNHCGSAHVVEALGLRVDLSPSDVERCVKETGLGFFYDPLFQGTLGAAAGLRAEIGIRTLFNLVCPLLNPAGAEGLLLGVYAPRDTEVVAAALKTLGAREAMVVHGEGTLDEISLCGPTKVSHLREGTIRTYEFTPEGLGLERAALEELAGGDAVENAGIVQEILEGTEGPRTDLVLLNAGAGFVVAGVEGDLRSGLERAREVLRSGKPREVLEALRRVSQSCTPFLRKDL